MVLVVVGADVERIVGRFWKGGPNGLKSSNGGGCRGCGRDWC